MVGEEKRHQMIQNLFGDQSEEEEEEEEVESEHESNRQPDYASDDGDGGPEPEDEGDEEVEIEDEGEPHDLDHRHGESKGERDQSSQEVEIGDQREESGKRHSESDEEEYGQHVVTSRRRDAIPSGSEEASGEIHFAANENDEVNHARSLSTSPGQNKDEDQYLNSAPEIRDVFGDSDDEEQVEDEARNQIEDENQSPMDEARIYEEELRPEDILPDEDAAYESEEEHIEAKLKEKPAAPPLELEIPLRQPPAISDKMNMIKVSNIMGIDPKPFDPRTYAEEDVYVTDESGSKKRIRLENNVVRWRKVKNPDGTTSIESNARFVEWSDGSLQLLIGNEVLDISKQDARDEQSHLFIRHGKGILQSQGRILSKMRFMPSSLTSKSHRMLTALVDSRHKKVYKVKNCITDIDPEREKEKKEKALSQSIKASELLSRKKEKVHHKYTPPVRRERQLSPGFLEDALEEEDEQDYYEPRRSAVRRRFDEDLELEARAEKRMINAKKGHGPKDTHRKVPLPSAKSSRRPIDFSESEESEYETEGEGSPQHRNDDDAEQDYAEENEEREQGEEEDTYAESEEEAEEPKQKSRDSRGNLKRKDIESDEDSPPRKHTTHRRMKMVYESDDE
ncbi:hypothetical protein ACS0TY_006735 [Phlomoides rotata]